MCIFFVYITKRWDEYSWCCMGLGLADSSGAPGVPVEAQERLALAYLDQVHLKVNIMIPHTVHRSIY
jgi:hypothetical protein